MDDNCTVLNLTLEVVWADDWGVGDHQKEYDCYDDGGPETCEMAYVMGPDGQMLACLSCIDDADNAYRKEIEKDLIAEALVTLSGVLEK